MASRAETRAGAFEVLAWICAVGGSIRQIESLSFAIRPPLPAPLGRLLCNRDASWYLQKWVGFASQRWPATWCSAEGTIHAVLVRLAALTFTLDPDEREAVHERANIMEFDGGIEREFADLLALVQTLDQRTRAVTRQGSGEVEALTRLMYRQNPDNPTIRNVYAREVAQ